VIFCTQYRQPLRGTQHTQQNRLEKGNCSYRGAGLPYSSHNCRLLHCCRHLHTGSGILCFRTPAAETYTAPTVQARPPQSCLPLLQHV
jgi:hypothetical protein